MLKALKERDYFDAIEFVVTLLIAFFFLIDLKIVVYLIAALGLNFIVSGIKKGFQKPKGVFYPFAILFIIYVIGLLFTENFDYGGKDIETRMSFLIFPLFYGLKKRAIPISFSWVIWAFVIGALCYVIAGFYQAFICWGQEESRFCFESSKLSLDVHTTYAALCLISGGAFALIDAFGQAGNWIKKIAAVLISVLFMFFVYKLYALGPWIGFSGMVITLLFAFFYVKKRMRYFFVSVVIFGLLGVLGVRNLELLRSDYDAVTNVLSEYFEDEEAFIAENQNNLSSVNTRIILWNTTIQFLKEHPFGVGTGDVKDELILYYRSRGMHAFADRKFNPHCQYLQTAGSVGILSALFLIITLFYYTWYGLKKRNFFLVALVALYATASLFESILERQLGIVFFLFFLCVFLTAKNEAELEDHVSSQEATPLS